jgi:hypothetical protein
VAGVLLHAFYPGNKLFSGDGENIAINGEKCRTISRKDGK